MPKISELKPGDLISDLDDDDHFMMWVGGPEALVENVDADYCGVFRHSDSKRRKSIAEMADIKPKQRITRNVGVSIGARGGVSIGRTRNQVEPQPSVEITNSKKKKG